jgi:hypothetical protein
VAGSCEPLLLRLLLLLPGFGDSDKPRPTALVGELSEHLSLLLLSLLPPAGFGDSDKPLPSALVGETLTAPVAAAAVVAAAAAAAAAAAFLVFW